MQETVDATNIFRKTVYNRMAKIWDTSIEFRGYWQRPTLRIASSRSISFSTDAKEILFSKGLVTGDEAWISYQNVRRERTRFKNDGPSIILKHKLHTDKILLSIWRDWKGI